MKYFPSLSRPQMRVLSSRVCCLAVHGRVVFIGESNNLGVPMFFGPCRGGVILMGVIRVEWDLNCCSAVSRPV